MNKLDNKPTTETTPTVHCSHAALVDWATLKPHPKNYNRHPDEQVALLAKNIRTLGWRHPVIVSKLSGYIVAGHARVEAAKLLNINAVPVDYQAFATEAEECAYLLADNRIAELAERDNALLKDLLQELDTGEIDMDLTGYTEAALEELMTQEHQDEDADDKQDAANDGVFALREDAIFPATNKYGIPDLLPQMLANPPPPPSCWTGGDPKEDGQLMLYNSNALPEDVRGGILAFYVDDWRFEVVWSKAVATIDKLRKCGFSGIITPDFSVWRDDPAAVQIWNIYRSRWCARYWQECGVKIIPSLNWSDQTSHDFAFLGLPVGAPVVSCQCRTTRSRKGKEFFCRGLAAGIEILRPESVWIYGGQEHQATLEPMLPGGVRYEWLESRTKARRKEGVV